MDNPLDGLSLAGLVDLLVKLVEFAGAVVVFTGACVAFGRFLRSAVKGRHTIDFVPIRLGLGRFLALGLEFQLAGDILRTAVAPTLREIAELAAIAAIRTGLNFFLNREIQQERAELALAASGGAAVDGAPRGRPAIEEAT